jgi:hypothetical protein
VITANKKRSATRIHRPAPHHNLPDVLKAEDLKPIHPNNPNILAGYVLFTPEKAQKFLDLNPGNRKIKGDNLRKIKRTLERNLWNDENPDPIVCNFQGVLDNGQHRLIGVVSTGVSIWALVIVGVGAGVMHTMDLGAKRTLVDRLTIEEARGGPAYKSKTQIFAAVRVCIDYDDSGTLENVGNGHSRFSDEELYQYFKSDDAYFQDLATWSNTMNGRVSSFSHYAPNRALALFKHTLISGGSDPDDVEAFFDELTGAAQPGHQIFELRKKLESLSDQKKKDVQIRLPWIMAFYIKGWNAFITGSDVKVYRYSPGGKRPDNFPELIFGVE